MTTESVPSNSCPECISGLILDVSGSALLADACPKCMWDSSRCSGQSLEDKAERINLAEIPPRFWKISSDGLKTEIQQWIDGVASGTAHSSNLFMSGPVGSGKTTHAIAIIEAFLEKGKHCLYVDCVKFLEDTREVFRERDQRIVQGTRARYMKVFRKKIQEFDVVVIDNLGFGVSTIWGREKCAELLGNRNGIGQVTIFCSQYGGKKETSCDGKTLADVLGEGTAKRILDSKVLEFGPRDEIVTLAKPEKPVADLGKVVSIMKNTPLKKDETACLDILARDGLFKLVATQERKKLTRPYKFNPSRMIEESITRDLMSWSGYHMLVDGPVLDYDDRNVLLAIYRLYWGMADDSGVLMVSLSAIARELGVTPGRNQLKAIKDSLMRLSRANVLYFEMAPTDDDDEDSAWISGKFLDVTYEGKGRASRVVIHFGRLSLMCFGMRAFFSLRPQLMRELTHYAQGIYCFLLSHRDRAFRMSLTKWRSVLGIDEKVEPKEFKRQIKKAINELIAQGHLDSKSHIGDDGLVYTFLTK